MIDSAQGFLFRSGGLFRCCIDSLYVGAERRELPKTPGNLFTCKYGCGPTMQLANDGVWQWSSLSKEAKSQ